MGAVSYQPIFVFLLTKDNHLNEFRFYSDDDSPDQKIRGENSIQGPPVGPNPFLETPQNAAAIEYKKGYVMRKCCFDSNYKKSEFSICVPIPCHQFFVSTIHAFYVFFAKLKFVSITMRKTLTKHIHTSSVNKINENQSRRNLFRKIEMKCFVLLVCVLLKMRLLLPR